jgi:hypothetical protein
LSFSSPFRHCHVTPLSSIDYFISIIRFDLFISLLPISDYFHCKYHH